MTHAFRIIRDMPKIRAKVKNCLMQRDNICYYSYRVPQKSRFLRYRGLTFFTDGELSSPVPLKKQSRHKYRSVRGFPDALPIAECLAGCLHMIHNIQPIPDFCKVIV